MAKIYETLRKKNDPTIEVYPNIESQNIPNGAVTETKLGTNAVTTGKLANSSVNSNKLSDGAVTTNKIGTFAVTNEKIADNSISNAKMQNDSVNTANIVNGSITQDKIRASAVGTIEMADGSINDSKLNNNLWNWLQRIRNTYNLYVGSGDEKVYGIFDTFTATDDFNEYVDEDINNALDLDRPLASDYTTTDLDILKIIIDGVYKDSYGSAIRTHIIQGSDRTIALIKNGSIYTIQMYEDSTNTKLFELEFDGSTRTIIDYYYSSYIYLGLRKLFNDDITYER